MKRILKLLLGFIIIVLIFSLWYLQSPLTVIQFMVIATICTAGIGGVVILFASYLVGSIAFWIYHRFRGRTTEKMEWADRTSNALRAITSYIIETRAMGFGNEDIRQKLRDAGWKEETISQAFVKVNIPPPPPSA